MKEYLIAFQYRVILEEWKWGTCIKFCKMTGANVKSIEDEIRKSIGADVVRIMTFSELEAEND